MSNSSAMQIAASSPTAAAKSRPPAMMIAIANAAQGSAHSTRSVVSDMGLGGGAGVFVRRAALRRRGGGCPRAAVAGASGACARACSRRRT